MYSKLSSGWLAEAQSLCSNVLRVTSSPSPSTFDKDAVLLHQFSLTLGLQLSDGAKRLSVSRTTVYTVCTYSVSVCAVRMGAVYLFWVLHNCNYFSL